MSKNPLNTKNLTQGQAFDLGKKQFSEQEIIEFAKKFDPLPFHTDLEAAKNSLFKGLVCSGSQAFKYFYVHSWIPLFGTSVLAGLEMNKWQFIQAIYVDQEVYCTCKIDKINTTKSKQEKIICWHFIFKNVKNEVLQSLYLTILHRI